MRASGGGGRRALAAFVAALLLAWFGFELRAVSAPLVLRPEGVAFPANADELYHVRRIVHTALHFPDFITTDRYVNHPAGSQIIWPPGFDFGVATAVRLLAAPETADDVERAAVWAPPLIGAFTIALVTLAGWFAFAPSAGAAAGFLLAILPAHFTNSQIGLVDHHVAAAAFAAAIVSAGLALLRSATPPSRAAASVALGVALAGAHWVWVGALFHAFIVAAVLVLWMALAASREAATRAAADLSLAHAVAFLGTLAFVTVPVWPDYGPFSPIVTSRLQPSWFAAAALALAAAAFAFRHPALGRSAATRAATAAGIAGAGVATAVLGLPGLWAAVGEGAGWFGREGDMLVHVAESQPLLAPFGSFAPRYALSQLSFLAVAFPFVWLVLAVRAARRRRIDGEVLVLVWTAVWGAAALSQLRFLNSFSLGYAWVFGLAFAALRGALGPEGRALRPRTRALVHVGLAIVTVAALLPSLQFHAARVREALAGRRPMTALAAPVELGRRAGEWLGRNSPETSGYVDGGQGAEYGVLSSWGLGHVLRHTAHRATVQDNFGTYSHRALFERASRYYATEDEGEAWDILDALRVRYVVADRTGSGRGDRYGPASMTSRLATLFGSEASGKQGASGERFTVPALERHRLVYHARIGAGRGLAPGPEGAAIAIFERVAGARVAGRARPGDRVTLELPLRTNQGLAHRYRASTTADADGAWSLRVPYPTDHDFSTVISAEGPYRVRAAGREQDLAVLEAEVRSGGLVDGPDFAALSD